VSTDQRSGLASLSLLGFAFVDYSLQMTLTRANKLPPIRATLRLAQPDDQPAIEGIAEGAFESGRYHADARFPVHLANLRYRHWIRNAFAAHNDQTRIYVLGQPETVIGFMHVAVDGDHADLRLGAVDRSAHLGIAGFNLYAGVIAALKAENIKYITAKISAANTPVLNLYTALGFQASKPEAVFHWHSPLAAHLVDLMAGSAPLNKD
jgi:L-amino acid N-acyltransferase YncA